MVLEDLIDRDGVAVIRFRPAAEDGFVLYVGPRLQVLRGGEPHGFIIAFVEQIPRAVF